MSIAINGHDAIASINGYNAGAHPMIDSTVNGGATLLVEANAWYTGITSDPASVTDSRSNSYTALTKRTANSIAVRIWYSFGSVTNDANLAGVWGPSDANVFTAGSLTGWTGVTGFDAGKESGATATSSSTIQPGSLTPSENNCLVITVLCHDSNSSGAVTISAGFTQIDTSAHNGSNNEGFSLAYQIQSTAAAVNPTWNVTNATNLCAAMAVFKGPGGGGGGGGKNDLYYRLMRQ